LARHALAELTAAGLPRLTASLSDLVAYGELTYSGRLSDTGSAVAEVTTLIAELRALAWLPDTMATRNVVTS
jgi:chromosome partitioning protein